VPSNDAIAREHSVSVGTAHRAVSLLTRAGLIEVSRGRRAKVIATPPPDPIQAVETAAPSDAREAEPPPPSQIPQARPMPERLQALEALAQDGIISAEEYARRRQELLREI
jgi:DNA-binding transcriptional MocR family regulator